MFFYKNRFKKNFLYFKWIRFDWSSQNPVKISLEKSTKLLLCPMWSRSEVWHVSISCLSLRFSDLQMFKLSIQMAKLKHCLTRFEWELDNAENLSLSKTSNFSMSLSLICLKRHTFLISLKTIAFKIRVSAFPTQESSFCT